MLSFYYCRLIALQQQKYLQRLKRYLNLLIIPSPNLPINDEFDIATHNAIVSFKRQLNRKDGRFIVEDGAITGYFWIFVLRELGKIDNGKFKAQELKDLEPELKSSANAVPYVGNIQAMEVCDAKLARIFGEKNAVVSSIYEPKEMA